MWYAYLFALSTLFVLCYYGLVTTHNIRDRLGLARWIDIHLLVGPIDPHPPAPNPPTPEIGHKPRHHLLGASPWDKQGLNPLYVDGNQLYTAEFDERQRMMTHTEFVSGNYLPQMARY